MDDFFLWSIIILKNNFRNGRIAISVIRTLLKIFFRIYSADDFLLRFSNKILGDVVLEDAQLLWTAKQSVAIDNFREQVLWDLVIFFEAIGLNRNNIFEKAHLLVVPDFVDHFSGTVILLSTFFIHDGDFFLKDQSQLSSIAIARTVVDVNNGLEQLDVHLRAFGLNDLIVEVLAD